MLQMDLDDATGVTTVRLDCWREADMADTSVGRSAPLAGALARLQPPRTQLVEQRLPSGIVGEGRIVRRERIGRNVTDDGSRLASEIPTCTRQCQPYDLFKFAGIDTDPFPRSSQRPPEIVHLAAKPLEPTIWFIVELTDGRFDALIIRLITDALGQRARRSALDDAQPHQIRRPQGR